MRRFRFVRRSKSYNDVIIGGYSDVTLGFQGDILDCRDCDDVCQRKLAEDIGGCGVG